MRKTQSFQWDKLNVGTCYYPEHWDKSLWHEDLVRMKNVGIETIRIAEFAWSKIEAKEGEFNFDFFDEFLAAALNENMKVIFSTPTATPPAWLTNKYPEVLNCNQEGIPFHHGMRRHYNYNSKKYIELSKRIVEKSAAHYAKHPAIIGWQIDNELNCETNEFYSESDSLAFREFLKKKYDGLDALNDAWGAVFWNQTYTAWDELFVPRNTINHSTNPHQVLDYIRFISDSAVRFCKMQSDILRKYIKEGDFITTNGLFEKLDNHKMADECLDVYTYDSYPNFAYCLSEDPNHSDDLNDRKWSRNLMETRSVCPHFGIMEQQSGANGWNTRMEAPAPKPGQMKLWAFQSIAHGADYVSFFRWRTAAFGTEIYWHGILDYDNADNRKLAEIKEISELAKKLEDVANASYEASVGILTDYDNIWDSDVDVWHKRLKKESEKEIFIAAQLSHTPLDMVYLLDGTEESELSKYSVLIYPHPIILTKKRFALLKRYVADGGTLVIGARAGQKDINGKCVMRSMPADFSELTDTTVSDFTFVGPHDGSVSMRWNKERLDTGIFNDILTPTGKAKVLAAYDDNYYKGTAALTETAYENGKILHFGGTFKRSFAAALLEYLHAGAPYKDYIELPADCEISVRKKGEVTYFFVLNFAHANTEIIIKKPLLDVDKECEVSGRIEIEKYGVRVYIAPPIK